MIGRNFFNQVAATVAITGMLFTGIADIAGALVTLEENGEFDGFIRTNSPSFRYRNESRRNTPFQNTKGEEYTFTAERDDIIDIAVELEDGSNLVPVLILISSQTGKQVAYDDTVNSLRYRVPTAGEYKLLVLGKNNTRGRYTLSVSGLSEQEKVSQADQVMRDVLQLRVIGCGVPNVAKITIGSEERCTRDIEPGQYVYQEATRSVKLVDERRELLEDQLELAILDKCPPAGRPIVKITVAEPADGKNYTYCANPTRFVQAGDYTYDINSDQLKPVGSATVTPSTDTRRQLLQTEYGLKVLDTCPAARTSLVVVAFQESSQTYTYCANPNRAVRAGQYTYNATTGDLDPAQRPQQCTVVVGGVCVVK